MVNKFPAMVHDINSIDELIDAFGGPCGAAQRHGISPQAVCNWAMRGFVPPSRHVQVIVAVKRMGRSLNPGVLGISEDDARLLGLGAPPGDRVNAEA